MIAAIGRINCFTKPCVTQAGFWFYKRRSEPQHQLPFDFFAVLLIDAQHAPADRAGQLIGDGTGQGEKLTVVIALGYGQTQGTAHPKRKTSEQVCIVSGEAPDWFKAGTEAALLAPTAMHQQKFTLTWDGSKVTAAAGRGFYTKVDLGIVKYHFEVGAGRENFVWG